MRVLATWKEMMGIWSLELPKSVCEHFSPRVTAAPVAFPEELHLVSGVA